MSIVDLVHKEVMKRYHESQRRGIDAEIAIYMTQESYDEFLASSDTRIYWKNTSDGLLFMPYFLNYPVFVVLQTDGKSHKDFEAVITKLIF